jgi:trans-aconitate methyltransferase
MSFDRVSDEYEEKSIMQQRVARKLIDLLDLGGSESVLDVGCGPGHITAALTGLTTGRVVGTDVSEAMIEEARSSHPDIEYRCVAAEDLDFEREFDAVFCNSALHWFPNPQRSLDGMYRALESQGRIGIACPATRHFSPFFEKVILGVALRPEIAPVFAHWRFPWFFLPDIDAYREMFERHGFRTVHISIDHEVYDFSVDEAYGTFSIGASVGYANPAYYECDITDEYVEGFNSAVREEMEKIAEGGRVYMDFNRLYYIGERGPDGTGQEDETD